MNDSVGELDHQDADDIREYMRRPFQGFDMDAGPIIIDMRPLPAMPLPAERQCTHCGQTVGADHFKAAPYQAACYRRNA